MNKPKVLYFMPYLMGVIVFAYSIKLASKFLLILAILWMFVAFIKPIYDWKKSLKKSGKSNDKE